MQKVHFTTWNMSRHYLCHARSMDSCDRPIAQRYRRIRRLRGRSLKIVKRVVSYIIFTQHARNVRRQRELRSQMSTNCDASKTSKQSESRCSLNVQLAPASTSCPEKRCHFISDNNYSRISWLIFIIPIPLETGMITPQSYITYILEV